MARKLCCLMIALVLLVSIVAVTVEARLRPSDNRVDRAAAMKPRVESDNPVAVPSSRMSTPRPVGLANPMVNSRGALVGQ